MASITAPLASPVQAPPRQQAAAPPNSAAVLRLPHGRDSWKASAKCRRVARNVVLMATGEPSAEVATELPEFAKTIQDAWGKLDDKYAVTALALAGVIALWGSTGLISAIDRLPLVPGILELVGIGYTGWFAYKNLVFKPDREALIEKVKSSYSEIIGTR